MRNTRTTYRKVWDSSGKLELIPDVVKKLMFLILKLVMALYEGFAAYQLVGEVKAHQG